MSLAAAAGRTDICALLAANGASVNEPNNIGCKVIGIYIQLHVKSFL
jgi:hypothetical protein